MGNSLTLHTHTRTHTHTCSDVNEKKKKAQANTMENSLDSKANIFTIIHYNKKKTSKTLQFSIQ